MSENDESNENYHSGFNIWNKLSESDKKEIEIELSFDGTHKEHAIFKLTPLEVKRFNEWYIKLLPKIIEIQRIKYPDKKEFDWKTNNGKSPWYGCAGGNVTFMIRPTGLCDEIIVKEHITGEILDITDIENL